MPALTIWHSFQDGEHTFSGTMDISSCDSFLTSLAISDASHEGLDLSLGVSSSDSCSFDTKISQPFTVSFSPTDKAIPNLERVLVNGVDVRFTVLEGESQS